MVTAEQLEEIWPVGWKKVEDGWRSADGLWRTGLQLNTSGTRLYMVKELGVYDRLPNESLREFLTRSRKLVVLYLQECIDHYAKELQTLPALLPEKTVDAHLRNILEPIGWATDNDAGRTTWYSPSVLGRMTLLYLREENKLSLCVTGYAVLGTKCVASKVVSVDASEMEVREALKYLLVFPKVP